MDQQCDQCGDEAGGGEHVEGLLAAFQHACASLDLDAGDESLVRTVARAIIEAGLAGEESPDGLLECALRSVRVS